MPHTIVSVVLEKAAFDNWLALQGLENEIYKSERPREGMPGHTALHQSGSALQGHGQSHIFSSLRDACYEWPVPQATRWRSRSLSMSHNAALPHWSESRVDQSCLSWAKFQPLNDTKG